MPLDFLKNKSNYFQTFRTFSGVTQGGRGRQLLISLVPGSALGEKGEKKSPNILSIWPRFWLFPPTMKPGPRLTYDWCFGGPKQLSSNQRLEKCNQFNWTFSGCLLKIKINWCYKRKDKKPNLFPRNFHSTGSWTLHRVLLTHINVFLK